jgi:hypothetical protein
MCSAVVQQMSWVSMPKSEKLRKVEADLADALQRMASAIGPRNCVHGDFADCEVCDYDDTEPMPGMLGLSEFALVMVWTNLDTGQPYYGVRTAPDQLLTHTNGLLWTALTEL